MLPGDGHSERLPDLDGTHDELWWILNKLRCEQICYLPPTLAIRGELESALEEAAAAGPEVEVRELLARMSARIRRVNATAVSGPAVHRRRPSTGSASWRGGGPPGTRPRPSQAATSFPSRTT